MEKVNAILNNPVYLDHIEKNISEEKERPFCRHHFDHLLDVARITYILILEEGNPFISREMSYAAGLLHDIGRWNEYREAGDHAQYSAELAEPILTDAGFTAAEKDMIKKAISEHRLKDESSKHRSPLSLALSRADSFSRLCYRCEASKMCRKFDRQPTRNSLKY